MNAFESGGGPAFPATQALGGTDGIGINEGVWHFPGMTLRDWFAGKAMQGLMAMERASEFVDDDGDPMGDEEGDFGTLFVHTRFLAEEAYKIADAMLKARAK